MHPFEFVEHLRNSPGYRGQVTHIQDLPARPARYMEPQFPLPDELRGRLEELGIRRLFSHQALALDRVRAGSHTVVVTGTASGKTLCYNLPVLERMLEDDQARALYLYPTKALARDQWTKLEQMRLPRSVVVGAFDGDTDNGDRNYLRGRGRIILSNMDMLHRGILTRHTMWSRFFRGLKFVVIDEMHSYRGVFGSHVGCVLRRLQRVCRNYGSDPVFIMTSATIGNPSELAFRLTGKTCQVIDEDGASKGPRKFVFWNPPVIGNDGRRRSALREATMLFSDLVESGVRNITFAKARKVTEIILRYAREELGRSDPSLVNRIMSYRSGYRPEHRRRIEQQILDGELVGVVSTNALELGVDIGGLDATVLTGYPGTISSTWQQAGRAGRATDEAVSFLIGLEDPLDQYLMNNPDYFFGRGHEQVLVNASNPYILKAHIACAACELPVSAEELLEMGDSADTLAWAMAAEDELEYKAGKFFYIGEGSPAAHVDIRSTGGSLFRIVTTSGEQLGEMEAGRAYRELHEGAIYLHAGESYLVKQLDLMARQATVHQGEYGFYTQPAEEKSLRVLRTEETYPLGAASTYVGTVEVTTSVIGYRKIDLDDEGMRGIEPLDLPDQIIETDGVWFTIPHRLMRQIVEDGFEPMGSIHAIEHAAISLTPLVASCDRWDVGGISHQYHLDTGGLAAIFIHDGYPGGVGIARSCYVRLKGLLTDTMDLLMRCPCERGCPSCIHSPKCGSNNEPLDKGGALRLLTLVLNGRQEPSDLAES